MARPARPEPVADRAADGCLRAQVPALRSARPRWPPGRDAAPLGEHLARPTRHSRGDGYSAVSPALIFTGGCRYGESRPTTTRPDAGSLEPRAFDDGSSTRKPNISSPKISFCLTPPVLLSTRT